jgi:hypothetical protein
MTYEISKNIIEQTNKCPREFKCLSGKKADLCKVQKHTKKGALMLVPINPCFCPYIMSSGRSYTCNCPTRNEIYKHYGV